MFKEILISFVIGFAAGGAVVYFYFGKAIAAGKEYLGQAKSFVSKL